MLLCFVHSGPDVVGDQSAVMEIVKDDLLHWYHAGRHAVDGNSKTFLGKTIYPAHYTFLPGGDEVRRLFVPPPPCMSLRRAASWPAGPYGCICVAVIECQVCWHLIGPRP